MDAWAKKDPYELLNIYTKMYSKPTVSDGQAHMLNYIEEILKNKGYKIVIDDNTFKLHSNIPQDKQSLYDMPIKELMDFHHKLVMKENIPYIPYKLRKTLIRRTKDIIINRGYRVDYDANGVPEFRLVIGAVVNINDIDSLPKLGKTKNWSDYPKMMLKQKERWNAIWSQPPTLLKTVENLYNVNPNKENMKNILVRVDNKDLVNYVYNKLRKALNIKPDLTVSIAPNTLHKFTCIDVENDRCNIVSSNERISKLGAKEFVITGASNADTIIDEVVKEYNKIESESFTIGGEAFEANSFKVTVFKTHVNIGSQSTTHAQARKMFSAPLEENCCMILGGMELVLYTNIYNGTKYYATRSQLRNIVNGIDKITTNA